MSLIDKIEKLREKPDSVKKNVAIGISIVFTFLAAVVWISLMLIPSDVENNTAAVSNAKNNVNDPVTILKDIF